MSYNQLNMASSKFNSKKTPPCSPGGIADLRELTRWVKVLQQNELALFDKLFSGKETQKISKKSAFTDEMRFSSVKEVIDSTTDEEERATRLINLVYKLENDIVQIITEAEYFQRNEAENSKIQHKIDTLFLSIFDASLLIKDAKKFELIVGDILKEKAEKIINKYITWRFDFSIKTKLPTFNKNLDEEEQYENIALFQQLAGKLPPSPIAHQILSFSLLEWQHRMFAKLKDGENVICCAPTSSGKTMIALGFIYAFLKNRPKSLLVYIAPNNVLAMEIAAVLNKYVPNQVSTLLDDKLERKFDERVVVCTPNGAFTHKFVNERINHDSFLVVDEVHCIGNKNGVNMEFCLRKFSNIQTLILSATMTSNTIQKLRGCIRNSLPINEINETTRFMIPQHMIPKSDGQDIKFVPLNPVGSIIYEDLRNPYLDIPMTPRDILSLFVKIYREFGQNLPEYLHPIRFFFIHNCRKPVEVLYLKDIEENEPETGEIKRLSLDDFAAWQKNIFDFLAFPSDENINLHQENGKKWDESVQSILDAYKLSLTDESTCECTLENAYKLVERLKSEHMLQALFFFPNTCRAFKYATFIFRELLKKPVSPKAQKTDKENQNKIEQLKKQLDSLERVQLNKGADRNDIKERRYQLEDAIRALQGSSSNVQYEHSLSEVVICAEDFEKLVALFKKWNTNITYSSALIQMITLGIGVLSGDMPYDLQVLIRKLYANNAIAVLCVTEDCAYGINTPTKTVVLSDGFTESQRRQMAGRAGRKGLSTSAWVIYFRLMNPEEAGQKLNDLKGKELILYTQNKLPGQHKWITDVSNIDHPYVFNKEQFEKITPFFLSARTIFGHSAIMAPFILDAAIKSTIGQTNRHIRTILSVIAVSPFNEPFSKKEDWIYELPVEVRRIYLDNGFGEIVPNHTAYLWLTNETGDISLENIESLVEVSKYWSHLFLLLQGFFPEGEIKLYQQIQDLIIIANIRTSTTI